MNWRGRGEEAVSGGVLMGVGGVGRGKRGVEWVEWELTEKDQE